MKARERMMQAILKPTIRRLVERDPLLKQAHSALSRAIVPGMVTWTSRGPHVLDQTLWLRYNAARRRFLLQKARSLRELAQEATRQAADCETQARRPPQQK